MTSQEERERQVKALQLAKETAAAIGLAHVSITFHTATCVLHYIEEANDLLSAANDLLSADEPRRQFIVKTLELEIEVLGNKLEAQYRKIYEMERQADNETAEYLELQERID